MSTRRELIAGAAMAALAAGVGGRAAAQPAGPAANMAAPPTLAELYAPPFTADTAMSPGGKRIAVLRNRSTAKGVESSIDLIDVNNPSAPPKTLRLGAYEAQVVAWANETRLLVWMLYDVTRKGYEHESIVRVIALNDDGTNPAVLFGNRSTTLEYIHNLGGVIDYLPDDEDNVLMLAWEPLRGLPALFKVDVNDGSATVLEFGALRTYSWLTQNGVAMIRLDADRRDYITHVMARGPGEADWKPVRSFRNDQTQDFTVYGATDKPGVFTIANRKPDEDKISIREVDLRTLAIGDPIYTPAKVDARGVWSDRRGRAMAASYAEDLQAYEFFDKTFTPHYAAVQKFFGPDISVQLREVDDAHVHYLGLAHGPQERGSYFLYDRNSHAVIELGSVSPQLTASRLGKMHRMSVRTRDGADLRAYLTAPASGAPGPLIVMPHGGPEARDTYGFDVWAQALAAKGWWVLQVNFRGSGGYGRAFAKQGWRHWGDRMQEDVEDATEQAIKMFKLDAGRVAIFGASYGGYAALIGGVRRPDFYKAVLSIAGVSDLTEMLRWERSEDDSSNKEIYNFWRDRIGDPDKDQEMLAKASPRRRAADFKAPVFLAHGILDSIVPISQSRGMNKALVEAGKSVEYWEIKKAGHSPDTPSADKVLLAQCITFLEKALA
jgi:dipeptidyl aminopeptidase/acylaminoacyl peptidase